MTIKSDHKNNGKQITRDINKNKKTLNNMINEGKSITDQGKSANNGSSKSKGAGKSQATLTPSKSKPKGPSM